TRPLRQLRRRPRLALGPGDPGVRPGCRLEDRRLWRRRASRGVDDRLWAPPGLRRDDQADWLVLAPTVSGLGGPVSQSSSRPDSAPGRSDRGRHGPDPPPPVVERPDRRDCAVPALEPDPGTDDRDPGPVPRPGLHDAQPVTPVA